MFKYFRSERSLAVEPSEDVVEDTTVLEVVDLWVSVESAGDGEGLAGIGGDCDVLTDLKSTALKVDVEGLSAIKAERVSALASFELHWKDSHTNQVGSVDSFIALSDDSLDSLEERSLGSPISGGARSVLLSCKDDGGFTFFLISCSGIEDGHLLTRWDVDGLWSDFIDELVDKSDVGEGSSCHDLVISSSGTVCVVVLWPNTSGFQVSGGWRVVGNLTSWRDMVGGDGVTQVQEDVSIGDALDWGQTGLDALEERWVVDVGGVLIPGIELSFWSLERLPHL